VSQPEDTAPHRPAAADSPPSAGAAPRAGDALLIVDVQRDFLPGGRLPVPHGDAVIEPIRACIRRFTALGLPVFASRDWHPHDHCSFRAAGGPWPAHCVAGTSGAEFAEDLQLPSDALIISKATVPERDAYSAFDATDLAAQLRARHVQRLFVTGLATDYCVLACVLDARALGYPVRVLSDAIAAVDVKPGDGKRAIERMRSAGAIVVTSDALG
jgi:nicotinamidase/pyrazinamidase